MATLIDLENRLTAWCANQGEAVASADEILARLCALPPHERNDTTEQKIAWLNAFIAEWEESTL